MKVLTVDDSRTIRLLVKKYLNPLNLEVVEAADGKEGLEVAQNEKPDLIILDVNMPVMDGQQTLEELRKTEGINSIPVLMLTAESSQKLVVKLIQMGISDYVVKPFDEELLLKKVRKILKLDAPPTVKADGNGDAEVMRVLVLDDNESVLLVARRFLTGVADVYTTTKGEKALQLACQHAPQVVMLDLNLPEEDSLQIYSTLRGESRLKSSRFVALATKSMEDEMQNAKSAGIEDILIKPFDKDTLTKMIAG